MCTIATALYSLALESCGKLVAARSHSGSATVVSAATYTYICIYEVQLKSHEDK